MIDINPLLSLLWCSLSVTNISVDIGLVVNLLEDILDSLPSLLGNWRDVLSVGKTITTSSNLLNGSLHESALRDAGTEEDGVESEDDPAALDEEDGGSEKTEPESELECGDKRHAGVVVLLDETANGVTKTGRHGLLAGWGDWWWLDGGEEDGASVGQHVEGAVDGEGQESEWVLLGEEPDECHGCGEKSCQLCYLLLAEYKAATYPSIECSRRQS